MNPPESIAFLTWIEHRRTRGLCSILGFRLVEITSRYRGVRRYLELIPRTFQTLRRDRPDTLIVQTPSMVLGLLTLLLRPLFRYRLVFDAHNEAVEPHIHPGRIIRAISHWMIRRAELIIVTNGALSEKIARIGGASCIVPDPLPDRPIARRRPPDGRIIATVICTFAADEPIDRVIDAARKLGHPWSFNITGNADRASTDIRRDLPSNVTLTGYLEEELYWKTLEQSDVIVDLTTMDNCLVCGAYEAIAVRRPVLLSRNQASLELFQGFGEFTDNSVEDICKCLRSLGQQLILIDSKMPALIQRFQTEWNSRASLLRQKLLRRQV